MLFSMFHFPSGANCAFPFTQAALLVAITVYDYRLHTSKLILFFHVHY